MLELILGISGSGKSRRILHDVKQRAEQGKRSILLVPEQFTSSTEGRIYHLLGDELSGFVDSYSFSSLAELLLQRYGGAATPTLSDAGRCVLVRRAVESLGDQIVFYRRHRRNAAFCQLAAETINELKSAGLTGERLAECAQNAGSGGGKLAELALIFSAYEALLQGTAMDPGDRVEEAARRLQPQDFAGTAIYIDEFDTFNASKKLLLSALLPVADVTVALCTDGLMETDGGVGLFSGGRQVANSLIRLAQSAGVPVKRELLQEDFRHTSSPGLAALNALLAGGMDAEDARTAAEETSAGGVPITLYEAQNRLDEARFVAAAVCQKAREGVPYSKMAVICRTAEDYLSALRYEFCLADIPLFFDEPVSPENTAPARAVSVAVELLRRGIGTDAVMALVKSGLCNLSERQQCALENYAYTWPLRAADWRTEFTRAPSGYAGDANGDDAENLALAESARAFLIPSIEAFLQKSRGQNATEISRQIYFLLQALGAETALSELAETLRAEQGIPAAEEIVRAFNVVADLLNQMAGLLGEETVEAGEYGELFSLLLRSCDLGHIPQSLDAVIFTTAGRMRLDSVQACFVMGLSEGEFPQAPGENGLLSHADREALISQDIEMPDCFENRLIREQICFYKALTAAEASLWLSWPGGDTALPLTSALQPVLDAFDPPKPNISEADLSPTPDAALDSLGMLWESDSPQTAALYAALQNEPAAQPGLAALRRVATEQPFSATDLSGLERLLGRELYLSPSRVEKFYTCRFGYFLQYVLHIRPRTVAELSPNQSGSLVHWVLENALRRSGDDFCALEPAALAALSDSLTEEYVAQNMPDISVKFGYLISRLKKNVAELLRYLQKDLCQSSFAPVAFEEKIGTGEGEIPPVQLETPDGHAIRVVGTIDRVDTMQRDGHTYLRVVDYKTGEKHFSLEEVYSGLDCQMLLYLFTLTRQGGAQYSAPLPAGVLYLMADPAPGTAPRAEAAQEKVYRLDGLVLDDTAVLHAMDKDCSGLFVPVTFKKDGTPRAGEKLADLAKLGRIQNHIDSLVVEMASALYGGKIEAEPLCAHSATPCSYCDYRAVCRHEDGRGERRAAMPEHYFDRDQTETPGVAGSEQNEADANEPDREIMVRGGENA